VPEAPEGDDLKRRNRVSVLSFFKTIENTPIPDRHNEVAAPLLQVGGLIAQMAQKALSNGEKKRFGNFKPEQVTYIEVNDYIKERLNTPAMTGNRKNT
jgi:hypothetical protein